MTRFAETLFGLSFVLLVAVVFGAIDADQMNAAINQMMGR